MLVVYTQVALLLLGDERANKPLPATNWLSDVSACVPGVVAAMSLSGSLDALDLLYSVDRASWSQAALDQWHLAEFVPVGGSQPGFGGDRRLVGPPPAADDRAAGD